MEVQKKKEDIVQSASCKALICAQIIIFICIGSGYGFKLTKEISFQGSAADNLNASIQQIQKPVSLTFDLIGTTQLGLGFNHSLKKGNDLIGFYKISAITHKESESLRSLNHSIYFQNKQFLTTMTALNLTGNLEYQRYYKLKILTNAVGTVNAHIKQYFKKNIILEVNYDLSFFATPELKNDVEQRKVNRTHSIVGSQSHTMNTKWTQWLLPWLRPGLNLSGNYFRYDKTRSEYLQQLTEVSKTDHRQDWEWILSPELSLITAFDWLFILAYVQEKNNSNSPYYRFNSYGIFGQLIFTPKINHSIYASIKYGFYDYYDREFHALYKNTKKDHRTYSFIQYSYRPNAGLGYSITLNLKWNESNDKLSYDRSFSKSYTSFWQNSLAFKIWYFY